VTVLNGLKEYRVIWSIRIRPEGMADHVMLTDWVPQSDILADARTKLFISHGGIKRFNCHSNTNSNDFQC